jgi:hypothetical protein
MHGNAKRAMVRIRVYRMDVRHLGHREQSEQNQTHNGRHRQSTSLCAAFSAQKCLKSCQHTYPCFKNTHYWTRTKPGWLWVARGFLPNWRRMCQSSISFADPNSMKPLPANLPANSLTCHPREAGANLLDSSPNLSLPTRLSCPNSSPTGIPSLLIPHQCCRPTGDESLGAPSLRRFCFCRKGGLAQLSESLFLLLNLHFCFFLGQPHRSARGLNSDLARTLLWG